jgi:hypothetical protein
VAERLGASIHSLYAFLVASEQMKATNLEEAALVMRAAAAYSTVMKNTSDILRHSLRLEQRDNGSDELPEPVISELTQAEIEQLRSADQDDELAPVDDAVDEAIETA